eukprot:331814_1
MSTSCSVGTHVFVIVSILLSSLSTVIIISLCWCLIRGYHVNDEQNHPPPRPPLWLFYSALIFVFLSIIILCKYILYGLSLCSYFTMLDAYFTRLFDIIFAGLYMFQLYFLWILLFIRLYYILYETSCALSVVTIRIYSIIFIFSPLLTILLTMEAFYNMFTVLGLTGAIFITLSISVLYIFKLIHIYCIVHDNAVLLATIARNTILVIICMLFSSFILFVLIMDFIFSVYVIPYGYQQQVLDICRLLDCSIRTCCLMFQFKSLHSKHNQNREVRVPLDGNGNNSHLGVPPRNAILSESERTPSYTEHPSLPLDNTHRSRQLRHYTSRQNSVNNCANSHCNEVNINEDRHTDEKQSELPSELADAGANSHDILYEMNENQNIYDLMMMVCAKERERDDVKANKVQQGVLEIRNKASNKSEISMNPSLPNTRSLTPTAKSLLDVIPALHSRNNSRNLLDVSVNRHHPHYSDHLTLSIDLTPSIRYSKDNTNDMEMDGEDEKEHMRMLTSPSTSTDIFSPTACDEPSPDTHICLDAAIAKLKSSSFDDEAVMDNILWKYRSRTGSRTCASARSRAGSCAFSEFGIDVPVFGTKEQCEQIQLHEEDSMNTPIEDGYEQLNTITKIKVEEVLQRGDCAIFDSLMQVYSAMNQRYIDVAGILTPDALYFASAANYKMWLEFKERTKIDDIVKRKRFNHTQITDTMAATLTENLDIIEVNSMMNQRLDKQQTLSEYLIGKTVFEIKLDFILNECAVKSIASFFGLTNDNIVKSVNCVRIDNIDAIDLEYIDQFIMFVFEDIEWIDQRVIHNTNVITLKHYHTTSIIKTLRVRKRQFFDENDTKNEEMVMISSYTKDRAYDHSEQYKQLLLNHKYDVPKPLDLPDNPFCFKLKQSNDKSCTGGLICQLKTNNIRHEWVTHLDYVIHTKHITSAALSHDVDPKTQDRSDKLMNDFVFSDDDDKQSEMFSRNFSFGIYLHYWKTGFSNSVVPKYPTFKQELLENAHATLSREQYYDLYEGCLAFYKRTNIKAANIGITNKKFKIPVGSLITINHLMSLKLYTDYTSVQLEFKKHCRRRYRNEAVDSIVRRNMEIAHWCRYLKESCTFYGNRMDKGTVVYAGLKVKLMFRSLNQHFECPLSTTTDSEVANRFAQGTNGIILVLRAANPKTMYFNVSWLSAFPREYEILFMGSSLKIVDIWINRRPSNYYISAIYMFEQIINGHFIDGGSKTRSRLLTLMNEITNSTCISYYMPQSIRRDLYHFLKQEEYDTESILNDIINQKGKFESNVGQYVTEQEMKSITDHTCTKMKNAPTQYIMALFVNFIKNINAQNKAVWLNQELLNNIKYRELKSQLIGDGTLFDHFGIDKSEIQYVEQYEWIINNEEYDEFVNMNGYIKSTPYEYRINNDDKIAFHLTCCAKYSELSPNIGLFFHLDSMPNKSEGVSIELDVFCDKKSKYRHLMPVQWLSKSKRYCGFQTFPYDELKQNRSIAWIIGFKMLGIQQEVEQKEIVNSEMMMSPEAFNIKLIQIIQNNDNNALMQFCQSLYRQNMKLMHGESGTYP